MKSLKFTLIFSTLFMSFSLFAQSGKITGKVLDSKNAEALIGVAVTIENTTRGGVTDLDGVFVIEGLSDGAYTVQASYVGYNTKKISEINVKGSEAVSVDINLEEATLQIEAVVVTAKRKQESVSTVLTIQRNSITVSDVLSGETIRRSPDRNVGDAIKRVSGVTIQDNKFPIIRGLNDRYNIAFVNGIPLPSTEPDRKAFSFDIFPSNIIDNIVVNKAATPDMPAEFAGGLIQLNTKDIPDDNFLQAQIGMSVNTQTMGNDFLSSTTKSATDWLGLDNGTRALPSNYPINIKTNIPPAERANLGKQLLNDWELTNTGSAQPSVSAQLSGGFSKKISEDVRFGGIISLNYSRNERVVSYERDFYQTNGSPIFRYNENRNFVSYLNGALANFSLRLGGSNKVSFKNNFNISSDVSGIARTGQDIESERTEQGSTINRFQSNKFFTNQLSGEHLLAPNGLKVNWNLGRNNIVRNSPNWSQVTISRLTNEPNEKFSIGIPSLPSPTLAGKQFFKLDETTYVGTLDLSYPFKISGLNQNVKGGFYYSTRDRNFDARILGLIAGGNPFEIPIDEKLTLSSAFSPNNYGTGNRQLVLEEIGFRTDSYTAESKNTGIYLMLDSKVAEKLRFIGGARFEGYNVTLQSKGSTTPDVNNVSFNKLLPSLNVVYSLTEKSNLRLSGSQTVSRPELRELAPFFFYDILEQRGKTGNPNLIQTDIWNGDIRYELFPEGGQLFSVSFFYKQFNNPIEERVDGNSVGNIQSTYINTKSATNFGAELEFRKTLSFISPAKIFEDLTVFGNLALIQSKVNVDGEDRALQGQSPYAVNFGIQYNNIESGLNANILFNQVGRRINLVSGPGFLTVWENPRALIDFQVGKKIMKQKGEIKFTVSDILNQYYRFYQDRDNDKKYSDDKLDNPYVAFRPGTTFGLSFSYKLQ